MCWYLDLNTCLKISLETVGARETARFVSVAAVSKTATASVTLTAVRINVSEKVVFRAWTSIMGMDATPTNTTEIMFWQQYLKIYIYCLNLEFVSYIFFILTLIWYDFGCDMNMSVVSVLSNYHPEVRRRISGSSSGGQGCVTVLLRCRWDQRVSRWPRCHDKYVCYQSQDIGGERIIR